MKKVLIATPCLYGQVDAWFVNSLYESVLLGLKNDILLQPVFLANESILPMARNELINLAYNGKYNCMVFIDSDELWDPLALIEIIQSQKDVVALPVVNKGDKDITFNVWRTENPQIEDKTDGYLKIDRVGTGFLKMSKNVISNLWESSESCNFRGKQLKYVCEYSNNNGSFVGEDINLCHKIKELGYDIWLNPKYTVYHLGVKMYKGDFLKQ